METCVKVCIIIQYKGTAYHGFQVQKNAVTVCEVLQNAMEKLYGARFDIKGCSRTDAGVHALGYCVSYTQPKPIKPCKLPLALNTFLPDDIRVISAREVDEDFHARYSAISKEYVYKIQNSHVHDVFKKDLCWRVCKTLDVHEMKVAAKYICGTHDFTSFASIKSEVETNVRTVHFLEVERNGDEITLHICADGFLYNMVRIIAGTLVEVGTARMSAENVKHILEKKDRSFAGDTAPACGLFLYKVNYS